MSSGSASASQPSFPFVVEGNRVHFTIDTRIYRVSAVQKAAYRIARTATVALGSLADTSLPATLVLLPDAGLAPENAFAIFYRELCDQELRERIAEETKDIRALLLAHAFSRTDLVRRD